MMGLDHVLARRALGPALLFSVGLLAAAAFDLRSRRIPNFISFPLLCSGVLYNGLIAGWAGATSALLGVLLGVGLLFVPFAARLIGGGDVKLLGAVGAWLGSGVVLRVALWTAALSGVLVLLLLLRHPTLRRQVVTNLKNMLLLHKITDVESRPRSQTVPIGAAMAAASLWLALGARTFPGG